MSRIEEALSLFRGDYNCAQSVLSTYCTKYGLDRNIALKLSTGFGGGIGRLGNICGAVSGSCMVIGLKYGMGINDPIEVKEKTYEIIRQFSNRFQEINGNIVCRELLGCDINTIEGKDYYNKNVLFEKKCLKYVKNAVEILEEIL